MKNKEKITRIAFVFAEAFEYFISLFVTGTMLGYLLDTAGFSDSVQGIIGTVATFTYGAQLFALFLSEKRVKRICTAGNIINQTSFVILYILPIFEYHYECCSKKRRLSYLRHKFIRPAGSFSSLGCDSYNSYSLYEKNNRSPS